MWKFSVVLLALTGCRAGESYQQLSCRVRQVGLVTELDLNWESQHANRTTEVVSGSPCAQFPEVVRRLPPVGRFDSQAVTDAAQRRRDDADVTGRDRFDGESDVLAGCPGRSR